jgi:hypothetical protein
MSGVIIYIGNILPDSFFSQHLNEIQVIFKEEPNEPIAYFLEFVYAIDKFREGILRRDESVMMQESFEDSIDKTFKKGLINKYDKKGQNNPLSSVKQKYIKKIFDFKEAWKKIGMDQKKIVEDIMIMCVEICDKYVIIQNKINKEKHGNTKHHHNHNNHHTNHNHSRHSDDGAKIKKKINFDDISTSSSESSKSSKSSKKNKLNRK